MTTSKVGHGAVLLRLGHALAVLGGRSVSLVWLVITGRLRQRPVGPALEAWLADTVVGLGPAFVKAAQLLSTRSDLLSPQVCRALARLHDRVRPVPPHSSAALRASAFGGSRASLVGAGSIACVYRLCLADGREVAVKVRRAGIDRALTLDLALLERAARVLGWLPALRGVPVVEIVGQLAGNILAQIDFAREADLLESFRKTMASDSEVTVPAVDRQLSTADVLVMEFIDGLGPREPEDLAAADRRRAVVTALRAVYRMLFLDGVVHCDLHPGNLYFRGDGSIVILDAGFTVRLSTVAREKFAAFFYCMSEGDGQACADIVLSTARSAPGANVDGFRSELVALIEASAGRSAGEFDLISFATSLFEVQRRYGFYADPQFVFPILSLLVLEGTVREFHPDVDFQREARPFLVTTMFEHALARSGVAR